MIQSGALGTKRECLSQLAARLKHDRIDDDAEYDAVHSASPRVSPIRRRTESEVRRDSCATVSCKTVRRRVVQTNSQVMSDSGRRSVSAVQSSLFSDFGQSHFNQEQFLRWMLDDGWY